MTIAIVIAFYVCLEREVRAYLGFRLGRWGVSLLYPFLAAEPLTGGFGGLADALLLVLRLLGHRRVRQRPWNCRKREHPKP